MAQATIAVTTVRALLMSTILAAIGVVAFRPLAPQPLAAQETCGNYEGKLCQSECTKEGCGGCCTTLYRYYKPKAE